MDFTLFKWGALNQIYLKFTLAEWFLTKKGFGLA